MGSRGLVTNSIIQLPQTRGYHLSTGTSVTMHPLEFMGNIYGSVAGNIDLDSGRTGTVALVLANHRTVVQCKVLLNALNQVNIVVGYMYYT